MKICWLSTVPWGGSSYSVLTHRTVPDIVRDGNEVVVSAWYGLQGAPQSWPIRPREDPKGKPISYVQVMPGGIGSDYGVGTIQEMYSWMKADALIGCMDSWVMPAQVTRGLNWCPWLPIDHSPAPAGVVESVRYAKYPMVYSKWGTEVLKAAGVDAHYVPCSADTDAFLPMDRKTAREKLAIDPDVFLVSMVAANKDPGDRKGFGEAIPGFAQFAAKHDDARLYVHTLWGGPIRIDHLTERAGVADKAIQPLQFAYLMGLYDTNYMRMVYSASDVLLNTAHSEGFGLPILEAQLCGCPVAVTDFSTSRELMSAGWYIPGQAHWSLGADSWRMIASIEGVTDALEAAYADRNNKKLRQKARQGVLHYDTKRVHEQYWRPALREIEETVVGVGGGLKMVTF